MIVPLYDLDPRSPTYDEAECAYRFRIRFTDVIQQMMYVSGETAEPSVDTTSIIEDMEISKVMKVYSTEFRHGASCSGM